MSPGNDDAPDPKAEGTNDAAAKRHVQAHSTAATPYATCAAMYWALGWRGILPLPTAAKSKPPVGFTGMAGVDPSRADVEAWAEDRPSANIGLRLPDDVVGIDVDDYDTKRGAQTLADAERRWGALPDTVVSTSRSDGVSGIRFFRVPAGTRLADRLPGGDVEVVKRAHRYAVVAPSIHPEGRSYRWLRGGVECEIPSPDELPDLPQPWLDGLAVTTTQRGDAAAVAVTDGPLDKEVETALEQALADLAVEPRAHHDIARRATLALIRLSEQGFGGVGSALDKLESAYIGLVEKRSPEQARRDFRRLVDGARQIVAATPSVSVGTFEGETDFWERRESLRVIWQMATARVECPWSVLGAVLCHALADVGPTVVLPAIVGSCASLNFFCALYGPSGAGKSVSTDIAGELWPSRDPDIASPLGSGEGLAARYVTPRQASRTEVDPEDAEPMVWHRRRSLFTVDEIGELAALGSRSGATLLPKLRTAWSGGELGNQNADPARNRRTGKHTYRATMIVGVQPATAAVLLDDHGTGTPQRFLWMPTDQFDDVPDIAEPRPLAVDLPRTVTRDTGARYVFPVPGEVAAEVRENHIRLKRGQGDTYDGHAMLARLKVAAALAVIDGRDGMTREDWVLSADVMAVSDATRAAALEYGASARQAAARSAGRLAAISAGAQAETAEALTAERYRSQILDWLGNGPMRRREIEKKRRGQYRAVLRQVLDDLLERQVLREVNDGLIEVVQ